MERFGVGHAAASMGLSMYVIGYGVGPLLFAPLCEIPAIGRNGVYTPTFTLFIIICVPTALVNNYGGLLVLRFLQGVLGSPCLANGAASVADIVSSSCLCTRLTRECAAVNISQFPIHMLALYLSCWTAACFWGPALGPVMASFAVTAKGYADPLRFPHLTEN